MHRDNPYLIKKPDFAQLASRYPDFAQFVTISDEGYASIDFKDASALRSLTKCLLKEDWDLNVDLREDRLCPTSRKWLIVLVCRLDYLLHLLDLEPYLPSSSSSRPSRVLDIGTGATAIYPILLHRLRSDAQITATELDETSYNHAVSVLAQNSISSQAINILHAPSSNPILFPILSDETSKWDLTICNPPFFGSEEEMREGQYGKEEGAHAAPTAAHNELITDGGEVDFVGNMIEESLQIGESCRWFTSLIGKYSSLTPLVDQLRRNKIDNYLLKSIKQSKTTRWILGWSYSPIRLPDALARPEEVLSTTSFSRLLPQPNTFSHKPQPAVPVEDLKRKVTDVLHSISIDFRYPSSDTANCNEDQEKPVITIRPKLNTWSRSARRAIARQAEQSSDTTPGGSIDQSNQEEENSEPLFVARIRFIPPLTPKDFPSVSLDWLEGKDRTIVEGLWKYILTKTELIGKKEQVDAGYGGRLGDGKWERGRGRGRGGGRYIGRGAHSDEARNRGNEEESINEKIRYGQRRRLI
ncbi:uncharacterized protein L201_000931 [Kwoniella dendrophila CBS 6074]|uniref:U6 small nuclear RNA (adenine-(43)-N(6))-methyltransferase n=1 Tax=Kwoniella dendrophila CBS 6074 TaxID=1295534 RepID=A0AAX4JND8_9TREE